MGQKKSSGKETKLHDEIAIVLKIIMNEKKFSKTELIEKYNFSDYSIKNIVTNIRNVIYQEYPYGELIYIESLSLYVIAI